ncbi:hypothetical protein HELRODRAFT_191212 [Helobdella robusta]|uniref:Uncharacterized protein n=1 Tax=Helobdella robusta TaxID=6412 RepID=T1FSQ9_HELRO|nr:hypothetical protein HELRODRAFT_191212 [Helobdella robusta]ESO06843.1 hypothetical protein HELRODRAFT_191212 [Helobdella robusta]
MTVIVEQLFDKDAQSYEISFIQLDPTKLESHTADVASNRDTPASSKSCCRVSRKKLFVIITLVTFIIAATLFAIGAFFKFNAEQILLNKDDITVEAAGSADVAMTCFEYKVINTGNERRLLSDLESRREVFEERRVGTKENIVKYDIVERTTGHRVIVLLDANRGLHIYKMNNQSNSICIVLPIVTTELNNDQLPSLQTSKYDDLEPDRDAEKTIIISKVPIKDTAVLGRSGQDLCSPGKAYWSVISDIKKNASSQQNDSNDQPPSRTTNNQTDTHPTHVRRKRDSEGTPYYACLWDYTRCYFFVFPDDFFQTKYYTCDITCGIFYY